MPTINYAPIIPNNFEPLLKSTSENGMHTTFRLILKISLFAKQTISLYLK